jgi:hypothetical protein
MRVPGKLLNLMTWLRFRGSSRYWEQRYRSGGNSGRGSYGAESEYKAAFLNAWIAQHDVKSVIDFGCGDGNQLRQLSLPNYHGYDVSDAAVQRCRAIFAGDATKRFDTLDHYHGETAAAALSLDVLFHLVEDEVFDAYLARLFAAAERYVIIYAVDHDEAGRFGGRHVRYRQFTRLIVARQPAFRLVESPARPAHLPDTSKASFFVYERTARSDVSASA